MTGDTDLALRVTVTGAWAEVVGAVLMDRLGPYAEEAAGGGDAVTLIFYPEDADSISDDGIRAMLAEQVVASGGLTIERRAVSRDWVDGWKEHFHPVEIRRVRVRPPWEAPPGDGDDLVDVVINPGLGFGTGLHPTTRGTLTLLQQEVAGVRGALVDAGTGSGILSIAAAKLGWGPIVAFDNDSAALVSTRDNMVENGVADLVEVRECGVEEAPSTWFEGATVLANMTLMPVLALLDRLQGARPRRLVVSGILAGDQERKVLREAEMLRLAAGRRLYEREWVTMELIPTDRPRRDRR